MKISRIRIQNFRIFQDQTINLDDYTCLVGPNGTGKSTVLTALNIFFRETANAATNLVELDDEDFHQCNTKEPVRITVTFTDLSNDAQTDFKDYFRVGELTVAAVAEFDAVSKTAQVRQYGQRLGIEQFRILFEQEKSGAAVKDLKETYETIQQTYPQLPKPGTKASMIEALRTFEGANPDLCSLIPSEDQFYGISRGKNLLEKYVQWVYIPAVKDAATERLEGRNTALSKLDRKSVV